MGNFVLTLIRLTSRVLSWCGLRSQRHWGVVYDSHTKQPVDPVVVRLINARTGTVVGSSIANLNGEYGFMVGPGLYKLFAQRANFIFPSQFVRGTKDGIYSNIYTGQSIEVEGGFDVLSLNIPLDPVSQDWNQQDKLKLVKVRPNIERAKMVLGRLLFTLVFTYSLYEYFFRSGSILWGVVFFITAILLLLAWQLPEVRLWGRVMHRETHRPFPEVHVKVTHPELQDVVIAQATTTEEGKFFVRLAKGTYRVHLEDGTGIAVAKPVTIGQEGLLNNDFYI